MVLASLEYLGGAEEHRHMRVVAAGVHLPWVLALVLPFHCFLNRKGKMKKKASDFIKIARWIYQNGVPKRPNTHASTERKVRFSPKNGPFLGTHEARLFWPFGEWIDDSMRFFFLLKERAYESFAPVFSHRWTVMAWCNARSLNSEDSVMTVQTARGEADRDGDEMQRSFFLLLVGESILAILSQTEGVFSWRKVNFWVSYRTFDRISEEVFGHEWKN